MNKLAIFASGGGSNAEAIFNYFEQNPALGEVVLLLSNKADAFALQRAHNHNIPTVVFTPKELREEPLKILGYLQDKGVDFIVLAGFMMLFPQQLVRAYEGKIVNIHPALLPKYGGKGMYGDNVHRAVIENGEKESGITIHYVNECYDEGATIFQATVAITPTDDAHSLAEKIHTLEHEHYPRVIAELINN